MKETSAKGELKLWGSEVSESVGISFAFSFFTFSSSRIVSKLSGPHFQIPASFSRFSCSGKVYCSSLQTLRHLGLQKENCLSTVILPKVYRRQDESICFFFKKKIGGN